MTTKHTKNPEGISYPTIGYHPMGSYIYMAALTVLLLFSCNQPKIGYIENAVVYEKFKATIEMKENNKKAIENKKAAIDELEKQLLEMQKSIEGKSAGKEKFLQRYVNDRKLYDSLSTSLKYFQEELELKTMQKSWSQINTWLKDFGKENNYDMIHGASGEGNLMYAKEGMNITGKVVTYINKRYDGE